MTATGGPALTPSLDSPYLDIHYSRILKAQQEVQWRRLDVQRANERFRRNPSRVTRRRLLAAYDALDWAKVREHFAGVDYDIAVARKLAADDGEPRHGVFTAPRSRS